jgi:flagellar protein FlgJ
MTASLPPLGTVSPLHGAASPLPGAAASSVASGAAATTYTDLNGLAALKNAPSSPAAIRAVSQQVEALFLQMMLKSMRDADAAGGETESSETGMYQDLFDKQVALTLSQHQDLGIARLFERQLGGGSAAGQAAPGQAAPGQAAPGHEAPGQAAPVKLPAISSARSGNPDGRAGTNQSEEATAQHAAQFVSDVLPTIRRAAQNLGVSPVGLLAQAALETGWGRRMARTTDGSPSLNMFGIKAGSGWNGARAVADTVEFSGGVATQRRTAFRAYGSIEESVSDFANLLSDSPRYREVLAAGGDAQAYVQGIARSGYATDPDYGNKLNQILNGGTLRTALRAGLAAAAETPISADIPSNGTVR